MCCMLVQQIKAFTFLNYNVGCKRLANILNIIGNFVFFFSCFCRFNIFLFCNLYDGLILYKIKLFLYRRNKIINRRFSNLNLNFNLNLNLNLSPNLNFNNLNLNLNNLNRLLREMIKDRRY